MEELGNPAEIVANLRKAVAAFELVAAALIKPAPTTVPDDIEVG
ncbi:hypothetical protein ACFWPU_07180 [Streptomyces sp. NPDC058471]